MAGGCRVYSLFDRVMNVSVDLVAEIFSLFFGVTFPVCVYIFSKLECSEKTVMSSA